MRHERKPIFITRHYLMQPINTRPRVRLIYRLLPAPLTRANRRHTLLEVPYQHVCRSCVPAPVASNLHQSNTGGYELHLERYSYNRHKEKCHYGHEYTSENVKVRTDKHGHTHRDCIQCRRDRERERRARERQMRRRHFRAAATPTAQRQCVVRYCRNDAHVAGLCGNHHERSKAEGKFDQLRLTRCIRPGCFKRIDSHSPSNRCIVHIPQGDFVPPKPRRQRTSGLCKRTRVLPACRLEGPLPGALRTLSKCAEHKSAPSSR